jgi:hypothetical protein
MIIFLLIFIVGICWIAGHVAQAWEMISVGRGNFTDWFMFIGGLILCALMLGVLLGSCFA